MPDEHSQTPPMVAGTTGTGKGSVLWRAADQRWRIDFAQNAEIAELVAAEPVAAERGRTRRRRLRLGSVLRLPNRRRSRTDGGA